MACAVTVYSTVAMLQFIKLIFIFNQQQCNPEKSILLLYNNYMYKATAAGMCVCCMYMQ